jgi:integrase
MFNYTKEGVSLYLFLENRYATKSNLKSVKLVVSFHRKRKYFPTGVAFSDEDWTLISTCKKRNVVEKRQSLERTFYKFKAIIDNLLEKNQFSFDNIERSLSTSKSLVMADCYAKKIEMLRENEQFGTARCYSTALISLSTFDSRKLELKQITVDWLKKYERHMLNRGCSYTTIGIQLVTLKSIINEAISQRTLDSSLSPFGRGKYEIPSSAARKLALPLHTIKQIYTFENPNDPSIPQYRDLWMFSYFCNGANFNDILRLKFKNINGNEISFLRGKTINTSKKKREIVAFLTDEMRAIIDRIGNPVQLPENYIFPYLQNCPSKEKEYDIIRNVIFRTNIRMKRIAKALGIPKVTTYTARHSYATVLKRSGANIAFISESLGHSDLHITENYLASFETEEREKNAKLLIAFDEN